MYRCDSLIFYMHLVFITTVQNQYMEEGERVSDANGFEWVWFLLTHFIFILCLAPCVPTKAPRRKVPYNLHLMN